MLKNILLVGLGGSIGSMLRYAVSLLINSKYFPYSTLAVNILGSFLIGVFFAMSTEDEVFFNNWKLFLATGLCGGFTTFSAFSMENLALLQTGKFGLAITYTAISIVFGIAAAFWGYQLMLKN